MTEGEVEPNAATTALATGLRALVLRHGAQESESLDRKVAQCVAQISSALRATSTDHRSLSPLDVARIRMGKFAASLTPPALFRDPERLAALRADIREIALVFVGQAGAAGSRFEPGERK